MVMKIIREVEKSFGLPKLGEAAEVLKNLPDEARLKQVKGILAEVGKLKSGPEELGMALALIKLIVEADMEHLNAIRDITHNILKLSRLLPKDALNKLPIGEMIAEVRKSMKEL